MTGRMITVADRDLSTVDFTLHALRADVGILMIVPKSLSQRTRIDPPRSKSGDAI
jgi:hypothetical protein